MESDRDSFEGCEMKKLFLLTLPMLLSGCLLETVGPIDRSLKPYGAHWVKDGMTDEQRLDDFEQCGGARTLYVGFSQARLKAERRADESNDFAAEVRLSKAWGECMQVKGYRYQAYP